MPQNDKIRKLQTFAEDKDLATFDELQEVNLTLSETKEVIGNLVQAIKEIKIPEPPTSLTIDGGALKGETGPQGEKGEDSTVPGPRGPQGAIGAQGNDGRDGVDGENGRDGLDGKDGSPDTAEQVRDKLQGLKKENRLDLSAIKGAEGFASQANLDRAIGILDQRTSTIVNRFSNKTFIEGVGTDKLTISATAPSNPKTFDLWIDLS